MREVLENLDEHTELLKKMLTEELFIPDYHKPSIINESSSKKTRRILKPHYKYEQVIHHCAIGQFKPIVMNGLYEFSCGSIPDRGVHIGCCNFSYSIFLSPIGFCPDSQYTSVFLSQDQKSNLPISVFFYNL